MGRRIVAFLIDYGIGLALFVVLSMLIAESATTSSSTEASLLCDFVNDASSSVCMNIGSRVWVLEGGELAMILLVVAAYWYFFTALLPGVSGYSIGKAVVGLRVISQSDGQQAGIGANSVRWLLGFIDFGLCFLIGLITGLASKGHRRLGDMAARTLVVDRRL